VLHKLHVKVGDTVKVISGHEKGQIGEVTKIFKHNSTIIVKDINLKTKHVKSREEGEPGQINKVIIISLYQKKHYYEFFTLKS
jgi:large subunit ribosomal protein L24